MVQAQVGQDHRVFPLKTPDDILAVAYRVAVEGFHLVVVRVACHVDMPDVLGVLVEGVLGRILLLVGVSEVGRLVRDELLGDLPCHRLGLCEHRGHVVVALMPGHYLGQPEPRLRVEHCKEVAAVVLDLKVYFIRPPFLADPIGCVLRTYVNWDWLCRFGSLGYVCKTALVDFGALASLGDPCKPLFKK